MAMNKLIDPAQLFNKSELLAEYLDLDMGYCSCRIRSNSIELIQRLSAYFSFIKADVDVPTFNIIAIESTELELSAPFIDWKREPGKTGRKDSYIDLDNARLIRKVRTGMVFYQSRSGGTAVGPCLANDNQVINFINNQFMNWLQQHQWSICHAAAVVKQGRAFAVAGFSGGGKSTLMLQMLEQEGVNFLTNDRLFIKQTEQMTQAAGIPKLPRINPGTIVHNPRLRPMLSNEQQQTFLSMPQQELWELEQKFDADIEALYGAERIQYQAPLQALLILNWSRETQAETLLTQINLRERPELLAAVMKSPGPFFQTADGAFIADDYQADEQAYLSILDNIEVYEATGGINFEQLAQRYLATAGDK